MTRRNKSKLIEKILWKEKFLMRKEEEDYFTEIYN